MRRSVRIALIGHRGVGKSSLLKRIEAYFREAGRPAICLDLDQEIAARAQVSIHEIFHKRGEAAFRELELQEFRRIDAEHMNAPVVLALGGGFDPSQIPPTWTALWVRRASDERGRIFTDRPRLNAATSPLNEYLERFRRRTPAFQARADEVLWLDEGDEHQVSAERAFLFDEVSDLGGAITVQAVQFRDLPRLGRWFEQRLRWGVRLFELRDDLLDQRQIERVLERVPHNRILLSFRDVSREGATAKLVASSDCAFDWPHERGACQLARAPYLLSLHNSAFALKEFAAPGVILKAALPTRDFRDLAKGHAWMMQDPLHRVFLPMSSDGRWSWYREWLGQDAPINFVREGEGSSQDQPNLLRWLKRKDFGVRPRFAAVLGDPVSHSRTPAEQSDYFAREAQAPVFAIRVAREEWTDALGLLESLGLKWAAVTAPLKDLAFASCQPDELATRLKSVNTLALTERGWVGTNTDREGFTEAWRKEVGADAAMTAIWGGGGTLAMILDVVPEARAFSARTGEPRAEVPTGFSPDTVIWAAGAAGGSPPRSWRPKLVFDLSYSEDSPARAFALERGARYISGLSMFRAQAAAQRIFWKKVNL